MPDYNFIAQPQVPDSFKTIGSMLNLATGAQQLKTSQQEYQRGGIQLQKERALLQPGIEQSQAQSATAVQGAVQADLATKQKQQGIVADVLGGFQQDPRLTSGNPDEGMKALVEMRKQIIARGVPEANAEWGVSQLMSKAHEPNAFTKDGLIVQGINNLTRAAAGAGVQAGVINAPVSMVPTPSGSIAPIQTQPGAPGAIQPVPISSLQGSGVIPAGIPPSQTQTAATDVLGQPVIAEKDQRGQINYKAPPGSSYHPVMQFPAGESAQTMPEVQAIRTGANVALSSAPAQHFNNKMILDLAPDAFTGTGGGKISKVLGAVGLQTTNNVSSDTAQLQHFIGLQIENNAKAQGANTDAARSLAAQAVLPTDSPEKAIKSITKVNDAYVTGNELYGKGLEAAISNPNNQAGIFAARQFKNAWASNFDPRITLLENAQKAGDKETINRVLGTGAQRVQTIKDLTQKAKTLQALTQGQM